MPTSPNPARRTPPDEATRPLRYDYHYCNVRPGLPPAAGPQVFGERAAAINSLRDKWLNGTELTYYFYDKPGDGQNIMLADGSSRFVPWAGPAEQKQAVRKAVDFWARQGLGLRLKEVARRELPSERIWILPPGHTVAW